MAGFVQNYVPKNDLVRYHPLAEVLWKIQYLIFGMRPALSHLVNVLLNCLNAILLFWVVLNITGNKQMSFFAGLLFALSPLHAEPASWLCANNILLSTFFFLAGLITFEGYLKKGKAVYYGATVLFIILAIASFEASVVLPVVLLFYDFLWGKNTGLKTRIKTHLPFFILLVFYFMFRFIMFGGLGDHGIILHTNKTDFLKTLFIRNPVNFIYPVDRKIFTSGSLYIFWFSSAALVLLLVIRRNEIWENYRILLFSLFLMLVTCLPYIGILEIGKDMWNSRYLYLASGGFCILVSWLLMGAVNGASVYSPRVIFLTVIIFSLYGFMLYNNNKAWVGASVRMRTVYNDLNDIAVHARRDEAVFIIDPPKFYKGARFSYWGFNSIGQLLSKPGKHVWPIAVTKKSNRLEFIWSSQGPGESKAAEILADAKTAKALNMNAILVSWDEGKRHLSVLKNYD